MTNSILTNLYKNILKSNNLVNTGKLLNSIVVDIQLENNTVFVNIKSLDYLKFLTEDYKLTQQFISSPAFIKEVENQFIPIIQQSISDILDGKTVTNTEPNLIVLYNGK